MCVRARTKCRAPPCIFSSGLSAFSCIVLPDCRCKCAASRRITVRKAASWSDYLRFARLIWMQRSGERSAEENLALPLPPPQPWANQSMGVCFYDSPLFFFFWHCSGPIKARPLPTVGLAVRRQEVPAARSVSTRPLLNAHRLQYIHTHTHRAPPFLALSAPLSHT